MSAPFDDKITVEKNDMLIFDKNQTGFLISSISINSQICIFAYYIETSVVYSVSMSKKNVGTWRSFPPEPRSAAAKQPARRYYVSRSRIDQILIICNFTDGGT